MCPGQNFCEIPKVSRRFPFLLATNSDRAFQNPHSALPAECAHICSVLLAILPTESHVCQRPPSEAASNAPEFHPLHTFGDGMWGNLYIILNACSKFTAALIV
ncbi:hypothetical protein KSP39_PZI000264 [Platanthera zijinensis]|uniref:Uncharacterized protein n=1 Tax=Platanthera zijinensis TaxID=2320716 RepID=A0AAP0C4D5_9ASPA